MHCFYNILICVFLVLTYVGSLYIWSNPFRRDHPSTIKRRFISILLAAFISSVVVYVFADTAYFNDCSFWKLIGIRSEGLLQAVLYPLLLTMVLFMGPFCLHLMEGMYSQMFSVKSWKMCVTDLIWLRDFLVAPFSEEFTFRACMMAILVPCFGFYSVFICPLFFGIAHLHHLLEKLAHQMQLKTAIMQSLFHVLFTTVFGIYSSFLFFRTGHFVSPFIVHAFCNHMGFPDFGLVLVYKQPVKAILIMMFVCGFACWAFMLNPLTDPILYSNEIYS